MISISPCVTATDAWLGLRPVANAFGAGCGIMKSLGIGKLALAARRSITAYKRGSSSRLMGTAPLDFSAILSEKKYAPPLISTANTSAIVMPFDPPSASPIKSNSSVNAVSKNAVLSVFILFSLGAGTIESGGACLRGLPRKFHLARLRVHIHVHIIARMHFAIEDLHRQRILYQSLDRALHRPRAVRRVVALGKEQGLRRRRQMQRNLSFGQPLHQVLHLQVNDVLDLVLAQRTEQHNIINAIQKFRTEDFPQRRHGLLARLLRLLFHQIENRRRAHVRSHDDHRVAKI